MIKDNSKGITLVALVITIIVMLILAGVSLNAIIGDNGIINNAQSTTIAQSCAVISEYLNEKYVELEANESMLNKQTSKIDLLASSTTTEGCFYLPKKEGVSNLNYIVDGEGNAFYLIRREGLPNDIKKQVKGGYAGEGRYIDYYNLIDVYGVTSDLQVYYCNNGKDSIKGITVAELDIDSPGREVFSLESSTNSYNLLSNFDTNQDGTLTATEVLSITELYVKSTDTLPNFSDFYNFPNLWKLTIEDKVGTTFDGIQSATKLKYVYLKGCTFTNYKVIGSLTKLESFYLYNIDDAELNKICDEKVGITKAKITTLKDLVIIGFDETPILSDGDIVSWSNNTGDPYDLNSSSWSSRRAEKRITSLVPLKKLSKETMLSINRISVQGNSLTSLDGLQGFENITYLSAFENLIEDASAINNLTKIISLYINSNNLESLPEFAEGSELYRIFCECNSNLKTLDGLENCQNLGKIYACKCDLTDISAIANLKNISSINFRGNVNLKDVSFLKSSEECLKVNLSFISLLDIMNIENIATIKSEINKASTKHIPSIYSLSLLADDSTMLDLQNESIKINVFKELKQYKYLTKVRLKNITLLNDAETEITDSATINEAFGIASSGWTNIQYLSFYDCNKLTDVSFIKTNGLTKLVELDLRYTQVASIDFLEEMTNAETNKLRLSCLMLYSQNPVSKALISVSLKNLPDTISNLTASCYWTFESNNQNGGIGCPVSYLNTLNGTSVSNLIINHWNAVDTELNLADCPNLTSMYSSWFGPKTYLPPSIKNYSTWTGVNLNFPNGAPNMTRFYTHSPNCVANAIANINKCASVEKFSLGWGFGWNGSSDLKDCTKIKKFDVGSGASTGTDYLIELPPQLEEFQMQTGNGGGVTGIICPNGTSLLNKIEIVGVTITSCDLTNFPNLTTVKLEGDKIADIKFCDNNNISSISLYNNLLNNLHDFSKLKKANFINIECNSTLSDFSDYNGTREDNVAIIASLNPGASGATATTCLLTQFYARGCTGVLNWSKLRESGLIWIALKY